MKSGKVRPVLCDPYSTLFNVGEVWEWSGVMYLLLERDLEKEYTVTIKANNQQCWRAFNLDEGAVTEIRVHTSVFSSGAQWVKRS